MATKPQAESVGLYEADFYLWAEAQAALLRARRFEALDLANLIEEVDDLGGSLRRSVLNNARVVMEHLLKLEHSPAKNPRGSWLDRVGEHRARLELDLTTSLRRVLDDERERVFRIARKRAAAALRDHGEPAAADALPATCPYSFDQITGDWLP